jgi:tRNA splicing endonuclease
MSDKYTRIYADNYRQSLGGEKKFISVEESLSIVYQTLIELRLEVKIVRIEEEGEVEISLREALSNEEDNLELQILNLAESEVLTQKGWNDLIEGWGGKIEIS